MKTGKSLTELAIEIERQNNTKKDFVARTDAIGVEAWSDDEVKLIMKTGDDPQVFHINKVAHQQIGSHIGMHKTYYDKCRDEAPELLANNIKTWFDKYPAKRLVRTLDGVDRAFLSDTYRPLDYYSMAEAILPTLLDNNLEIMSSEITETRLYIKAVHPRIKRDIPKGTPLRWGDGHKFFDTVSPAIIISNSEVGMGSLAIESGVFTAVCTNLMHIAKSGMRRRHVGARHDLTDVENVELLLTSETRTATDKAIWLQVRDIVRGAFDEAVFEGRCRALEASSANMIEGDPVKTVELAAKRFGLTDTVRGQIQRHLIEGADLSQYGLLNAVTRAAQDVQSYDLASEMEAIGGKIFELPRSEWREFAAA